MEDQTIEDGIVVPHTWYRVDEDIRVYHFPGGSTYQVVGVNRLRVSNRDTHYLEDNNGNLHIVRNSWIAITVVE